MGLPTIHVAISNASLIILEAVHFNVNNLYIIFLEYCTRLNRDFLLFVMFQRVWLLCR